MYVQETGRGGGDGSLCKAYLYYGNLAKCSIAMQDCCKNVSVCYRQHFMSHFAEGNEVKKPTNLHDCCSICEQSCSCEYCRNAMHLPQEIMHQFDEDSDSRCETFATSSARTGLKIKQQLLNYRSSITPLHYVASMMVKSSLLTGISDKLIEEIAKQHTVLKDVESLLNIGVGSSETAEDILEIILKCD